MIFQKLSYQAFHAVLIRREQTGNRQSPIDRPVVSLSCFLLYFFFFACYSTLCTGCFGLQGLSLEFVIRSSFFSHHDCEKSDKLIDGNGGLFLFPSSVSSCPVVISFPCFIFAIAWTLAVYHLYATGRLLAPYKQGVLSFQISVSQQLFSLSLP